MDRNILSYAQDDSFTRVVPYVGTWIEIGTYFVQGFVDGVVPYVGTWIEILVLCPLLRKAQVVPYVGTWIEISMRSISCPVSVSFPTWERG